MEAWTSLGYTLGIILAMGVGAIGGILTIYWFGQKRFVASVKYTVDRLKVAEADVRRLEEDLYVLKRHLQQRCLLDDEDLADLRRDLVERPRQLEAERDELLKEATKHGFEDRLVKNGSDTLQ